MSRLVIAAPEVVGLSMPSGWVLDGGDSLVVSDDEWTILQASEYHMARLVDGGVSTETPPQSPSFRDIQRGGTGGGGGGGGATPEQIQHLLDLINEALAAAQAAGTAATGAVHDLLEQQEALLNLQANVGQVFRQPNKPLQSNYPGRIFTGNDQWFDTDDNNHMYVWDTTLLDWVNVENSLIAKAAEDAAAAKDYALGVAGQAAQAIVDAGHAVEQANATNAQSLLLSEAQVVLGNQIRNIGGANLASNGDFEANVALVVPAYAATNGLVAAYDGTYTRTVGGRAIKMDGTSTPAGAVDDMFLVPPIDVLPLRGRVTYTDSVWVWLAQAPAPTARRTGLWMAIGDSGNTQVRTADLDPALVNRWQRLSITYTTLANPTIDRRLYVTRDAVVWFDQYQVEEGSIATGWKRSAAEFKADATALASAAQQAATQSALTAAQGVQDAAAAALVIAQQQNATALAAEVQNRANAIVTVNQAAATETEARQAAITATAAAAATAAENARQDAIYAAAADAIIKANQARDSAISSAATDAAARDIVVQTAAAADAVAKANLAETKALASATILAKAAQDAAVLAASQDATTKAENARLAALTAASTYADSQAAAAQAAATSAAALDATSKANTAQQAAQTAAQQYADAVRVGAVNLIDNSSVEFDPVVINTYDMGAFYTGGLASISVSTAEHKFGTRSIRAVLGTSGTFDTHSNGLWLDFFAGPSAGVFSVWVKAPAGNTVDLRLTRANASATFYGAQDDTSPKIPTTGDWQRISLATPERPTAAQGPVTLIRSRISLSAPPGTAFFVDGLKYETGTRLTDWTPSPNDVQRYADVAKQAAIDAAALDATSKADKAKADATSAAASAASGLYSQAKLLTESWVYPATTEFNGAYLRTGTLAANQIVVGGGNSAALNTYIDAQTADAKLAALTAAKMGQSLIYDGTFALGLNGRASPGYDEMKVMTDGGHTGSNYGRLRRTSAGSIYPGFNMAASMEPDHYYVFGIWARVPTTATEGQGLYVRTDFEAVTGGQAWRATVFGVPNDGVWHYYEYEFDSFNVKAGVNFDHVWVQGAGQVDVATAYIDVDDATLFDITNVRKAVDKAAADAKGLYDLARARIADWTYPGTTEISGAFIRTGTLAANQIVVGGGDARNIAQYAQDQANLAASKVRPGSINRLSNSTFKRGQDATAVYGQVAQGWAIYNNGGAAEAVVPSFPTADSIRLDWTKNTTTKGLFRFPGNDGATEPNKTYVLSFDAMGAPDPAFTYAFAINYNTQPASFEWLSNPPLTGTYQRYEYRFTTGATVDVQTFFINRVTSAAGWTQYRRVQLEEGNTPTAYGPSAADTLADAALNAAALYDLAKARVADWTYPSTTEIHGAYIRTGTIAANQIVVSSTDPTTLSASLANTATALSTTAGILNAGTGGTNLFTASRTMRDDPSYMVIPAGSTRYQTLSGAAPTTVVTPGPFATGIDATYPNVTAIKLNGHLRAREIAQAGSWYTLSFWYKRANATNVYFATDLCDLGGLTWYASAVWQKATQTVQVGTVNATYNFVDFEAIGASAGEVLIYQPMLEIGRMVSTYSPSPEEVAADAAIARNAGPNLLTNSSFERDYHTVTSTVVSVTYPTPALVEGNRCMRLTRLTAGDQYTIRSNELSLTAGVPVTISYYSRGHALRDNPSIDLQGEGIGTYQTGPTVSRDGTVRRYSHTLTPDATGLWHLVYRGSTEIGGWVDYDAVKVEVGTKATAWSPHPQDALDAAAIAAKVLYDNARLRVVDWTYPNSTEIQGTFIRTGTIAVNQIVVGGGDTTPLSTHLNNKAAAATRAALITGATAKTFTNPFTFEESVPSAPGVIVIDTPITQGNFMCTIHLVGYSYSSPATEIDATVSFYAYSDGSLYNTSQTSAGSCPVNVRLAYKSNKVSLLIDRADGQAWAYPKISVATALIGHVIPPDSFYDGWAGSRIANGVLGASYVNVTTPVRRDINDTNMLTQKWRQTGKTTINGGNVEADSITAIQIASRSITTEELTIGSLGDNMVGNPRMADTITSIYNSGQKFAVGWFSEESSINPYWEGPNATWGGSYMVLPSAKGTDTANSVVYSSIGMNGYAPARPGETFSAQALLGSAGSGSSAYLRVRYYNAAGVQISSDDVVANLAIASDDTLKWYGGQSTAPAGTCSVRVQVYNTGGYGAQPGQTSYMVVKEVALQRVILSAQIGNGQIDTPKLKAGAVDTSILTVSSRTDNAVSNGNLLEAKALATTAVSPGPLFAGFPTQTGGGGATYTVIEGRVPGSRALGVTPPAGGADWFLTPAVPVKAGEDWYWSVDVYTTNRVNLYVRFSPSTTPDLWTNPNGLTDIDSIGGPTARPENLVQQAASGWVTYSGRYTVPVAGCSYVFFRPHVWSGSVGSTYFANFTMRRAVGSTVIIDDSVTTGKIVADAITAKHTLTGPKIQTVADDLRGVKITSAGLVGYGNGTGTIGAGQASFIIDAGSGAVTLLGPLVTSASIKSSTVTGGTLQTQEEGARGIKITSAGLIGYDTAGSPKFSLDTAGNLSLLGTIRAGSTIYGDGLVANTVKVTSLAVGDFDNQWPDRYFNLGPEPTSYFLPGIVSSAWSAGGPVGGRSVQTTVRDIIGQTMISARPGDEFFLSFDYRLLAGPDKGVNGSLWLQTADGSNPATIQPYAVPMTGGTTLDLGGGWYRRSGGVVLPKDLPNDVARARFWLNINQFANEATYAFTNIEWRRRNDGSLIVNGAIDGKTITGAYVQTVTAGDRGVKLTPTGIIAFSDGTISGGAAAGTPTFVLNAATGGVTIRGDLTSGSTVSGAKVTGGTIESEATANRGVKITSGGLVVYSDGSNGTAGTAAMTLSANGNLALSGTITGGGKIIGPSFETTPTLSRGVKILSTGLIAYSNGLGPTTASVTVPNADFETGAGTKPDNWSTFWQINSGVSEVAFDTVAANRFTGSKSVKITPVSGGANGVHYISGGFDVTGGTTLTVRVYAFTNVPSAGRLQLSLFTTDSPGNPEPQFFGDGVVAVDDPTVYALTVNFVAYQYTFTIPARAVRASINLKATTTGAATNIWFDTVSATASVPALAAGAATVVIDGTTGNISMVGTLNSGSAINGAVVTGGVLQTETTSRRGLKINSAGLAAYDASGNATFVVNAGTGALALLGSLTGGGTITGPALQTAASGERIVIRNDGSGGIIEAYSGTASDEVPGALDPSAYNDRGTIYASMTLRPGRSAATAANEVPALMMGGTSRGGYGGIMLVGGNNGQVFLGLNRNPSPYIRLDNSNNVEIGGNYITLNGPNGGSVAPTLQTNGEVYIQGFRVPKLRVGNSVVTSNSNGDFTVGHGGMPGIVGIVATGGNGEQVVVGAYDGNVFTGKCTYANGNVVVGSVRIHWIVFA